MSVGMLDGGRVTAMTIGEEPRDASDRGDTDPGHVVDAAIGKVFLQQADDPPAIDQRLQLGRRAQVLEKIAAFAQILQADDRSEEGVLIAFLLPGRFVSVGFHGLCIVAFVLTC